MNSQDYFKAGFALPMYGLKSFTFRYFDEEITLPHGAVMLVRIGELSVAKINDVRSAWAK